MTGPPCAKPIEIEPLVAYWLRELPAGPTTSRAPLRLCVLHAATRSARRPGVWHTRRRYAGARCEAVITQPSLNR
jgi:hypothetical protein